MEHCRILLAAGRFWNTALVYTSISVGCRRPAAQFPAFGWDLSSRRLCSTAINSLTRSFPSRQPAPPEWCERIFAAREPVVRASQAMTGPAHDQARAEIRIRRDMQAVSLLDCLHLRKRHLLTRWCPRRDSAAIVSRSPYKIGRPTCMAPYSAMDTVAAKHLRRQAVCFLPLSPLGLTGQTRRHEAASESETGSEEWLLSWRLCDLRAAVQTKLTHSLAQMRA